MEFSTYSEHFAGATYIKRMCHRTDRKVAHLHTETAAMIARASLSAEAHRARKHWRQAIEGVQNMIHSPSHFRIPFMLANREHMSEIDCFDGHSTRHNGPAGVKSLHACEGKTSIEREDLFTITPLVDGRLKDIGRH